MTKVLAPAALAAALAFAAPAVAQSLPDYYPKDYSQIVEGSKKENKLVVYSIMAEYNWRPVIEGFKKKFPWIDVQTLDLGSGEVFERYYAERASGARSGDLMINGAVDKWLQFVGRGELVDYVSAEAAKVPDWSKPRKGLYTVSADPMVIVYNKALIPEAQAPKSLADLAKMVSAAPARFKNKITTYNAGTEAFGLAINWAYVKSKGDAAWGLLEQMGKVVRAEGSAGPMVEKITAGEYMAGYFISAIVLYPRLNDPARAKILGWAFPTDGTPIIMRGMGIAKGATNVNSAKLMLDHILSHEGQVAFGKGGLTPYRADVKDDEVPRYTFSRVAREAGGEQNLVIVDYDDNIVSKGPDFQARWKKVFGTGG
ncbi:MAG: extracellular solute-binding protein [Alphaproteobacteria bacterium]|nr:extracellular solute-binding protein [Alphaproteobacteria bacterium]